MLKMNIAMSIAPLRMCEVGELEAWSLAAILSRFQITKTRFGCITIHMLSSSPLSLYDYGKFKVSC